MPASSWIDAFLHLAHFATVQRREHERRALSQKRSARRRRQFREVLGNASNTSESRMNLIHNSECTYKAISQRLPDGFFRTLKRCGVNPLDGASDRMSEIQMSDGRCRVGRLYSLRQLFHVQSPRPSAITSADVPISRNSRNRARDLLRLIFAQCVHTTRGIPSRASDSVDVRTTPYPFSVDPGKPLRRSSK